MGRRGAREWPRRGDGQSVGDANLNAVLAIAAAQSLSAWFDPNWTPGATLVDDAGTERMTALQSRPISGQSQYSVPPVATSLAPATSTSPNGRRVLSFNGARYMGGLCSLAANFQGTAAFTAVSLSSRTASGSMIKWSLGDSSGTDNRIARGHGGTNSDFMNRVAAGAGTAPTGLTVPINTVQVYSEVFTGTTVSAWLHGASSISAAANTRAPAALDELWFGAQRASGVISTFLAGIGGPLWICAGVLSDATRIQLQTAFGAYYGVVL